MNELKLSKIPSEILTQALIDLGKCERAAKYTINMGSWHSGDKDDCEVCLAGSYLAQTVGLPYWVNLDDPDDPPEAIGKQMNAIEAFRCGQIDTALELLGIGLKRRKQLPESIGVPYYRDYDRRPFKNAIRKLVKMLQGAGL